VDEIAHHESKLPDFISEVRARTPARLLVGRAGASYRTATYLELRRDHAVARDAVHAELGLADLGPDLIGSYDLFQVQTQATSKDDYLLHPDRGRRLEEQASSEIARRCRRGADLQVVIGDGLSATAVVAQVPELLPLLAAGAAERGWSFWQSFVVRYCRVGILNDVGEILDPAVVVLLIGERPGLATAESLSAYLAYRPRAGHTDAQRNLISNIHRRGVSQPEAARRILALAQQMMRLRMSGVGVKEELPTLECTPLSRLCGGGAGGEGGFSEDLHP
jgi:ethanolamine ammonia-lyase small subunit